MEDFSRTLQQTVFTRQVINLSKIKTHVFKNEFEALQKISKEEYFQDFLFSLAKIMNNSTINTDKTEIIKPEINFETGEMIRNIDSVGYKEIKNLSSTVNYFSEVVDYNYLPQHYARPYEITSNDFNKFTKVPVDADGDCAVSATFELYKTLQEVDIALKPSFGKLDQKSCKDYRLNMVSNLENLLKSDTIKDTTKELIDLWKHELVNLESTDNKLNENLIKDRLKSLGEPGVWWSVNELHLLLISSLPNYSVKPLQLYEKIPGNSINGINVSTQVLNVPDVFEYLDNHSNIAEAFYQKK